MAVTAAWYGKAFLSAFNKETDWDTNAIKMMLTTSAYTPDQDAHQYKSDVTNEVAGTGYTAGGAALTSVTIGYTAATNVIKFNSAAVSWSTATITARYAVIYDSTPASDATRPLYGYQNFGADVSSTAGTFTVTPNAAGWFTITVGAEG
jgi:hypothetical protein